MAHCFACQNTFAADALVPCAEAACSNRLCRTCAMSTGACDACGNCMCSLHMVTCGHCVLSPSWLRCRLPGVCSGCAPVECDHGWQRCCACFEEKVSEDDSQAQEEEEEEGEDTVLMIGNQDERVALHFRLPAGWAMGTPTIRVPGWTASVTNTTCEPVADGSRKRRPNNN